MKSRTRHIKRNVPRTIYDLVSREEVDKELNKAGISNEELKELRENYFQPIHIK